MKKFFGFVLSAALLLSLTGCEGETLGSSEISSNESSAPVSEESRSPTDDIVSQIIANDPNAEVIIGEDGTVTIISGQEDDLRDECFPSYEEVKSQYPDKTVLVWTLNDADFSSYTRTHEINEYLAANGYDFVVCFDFVERQSAVMGNYPDERLDGLKKALSEGRPVDIVGTRIYHEYVAEGLLEPLDGYLESTETGKKIYELMPENYWECLRANGSIYGVNGSLNCMLDSDGGYFVNAELAEKYGFDIEKPILEQLDILKAVKENEKNCAVFSLDIPMDLNYYVHMKQLGGAVYWDGETHSAKCVLDNPEYMELLKFFDTLNKEGVLTLKTSYSAAKPTFFITQRGWQGGALGYDGTERMEYDYYNNIVTAIPVFGGTSSLRSHPYMVTGVCSGSEHKDMAFELLALTQSDPELCNLLTFGIEGVDYNVTDGKVDRVENFMNPELFGNKLINYSFEGVDMVGSKMFYSADKYREIFENAQMHADHDFCLDDRNIRQELNAVMDIMDKFVLPGKDKSLDGALAELREKLNAAGLQKIIDEWNSQYEVYNEKN